MTRIWFGLRASLAIAAITVLISGCTPLPDYPTSFRLTLMPSDGETIVLTAADADRPAIFGDLAALGQQNASLLLMVSNGGSGDDAIGFWYWRYETDAEGWVEEIRVAIGSDTYAPDAVAVDGADPIPDAFFVERYTAADGEGSFGRIVGDIAPVTIDGAGAGSVEVRLDDLDALLYASDDAPAEPSF